jgi:short-subunit dehydrogenase
MRIDGASVLLTGATGGLGQAIARELRARGAKLILTGRRTELLEPLARELDARALTVDLSDAGEVERLLREAGEVDILVANAALPGSGELEGFSVEQIDRALEVNLRAPIVMTHALAPAMRGRGGGHLLFVSSLSGKAASPHSSLYNATKFGLRGFALALREDLRRDGVGVSVVLPGFIRDAGLFADSGVELPPGIGTRSPQDVANAVVSAIERNRAEIDVAPVGLKLGTAVASIAPALSAAVSRRMGSERIATRIVAGQRARK